MNKTEYYYTVEAFDANENVMSLDFYKTLKGAMKACAKHRQERPEWRHIITKEPMDE